MKKTPAREEHVVKLELPAMPLDVDCTRVQFHARIRGEGMRLGGGGGGWGGRTFGPCSSEPNPAASRHGSRRSQGVRFSVQSASRGRAPCSQVPLRPPPPPPSLHCNLGVCTRAATL